MISMFYVSLHISDIVTVLSSRISTTISSRSHSETEILEDAQLFSGEYIFHPVPVTRITNVHTRPFANVIQYLLHRNS